MVPEIVRGACLHVCSMYLSLVRAALRISLPELSPSVDSNDSALTQLPQDQDTSYHEVTLPCRGIGEK